MAEGLLYPGKAEGKAVARATEVVNIGRELRHELELAARREQRDAANLGRLLIREGLAQRARGQSSPNSNASQLGQ